MKLELNEFNSVLLPKGDNSAQCKDAFEQETGVEIPDFPGKKLSVTSRGITFYNVRARDIPYLIDKGVADIGVTGVDNCIEFGTDRYQEVGESMGAFCLMAAAPSEGMALRYLGASPQKYKVSTSYPNLLKWCAQASQLNIEPAVFSPGGSVEVMPELLGLPLVADVVARGETYRANGLVIVRQLLSSIKPAILERK